MSAQGPPKFKPFTKTKVALSLEATPLPIDQHTDITAFVPNQFRVGIATGIATAAGLGTGTAAGLGTAAGTDVESTAPKMFVKRPRQAPGAPREPIPGMPEAFPGIIARTKRIAPGTKTSAITAPRVYARIDVLSRDLQAAELGKLPQALQEIATGLLNIETSNPYQIEPVANAFVPLSRNGFGSFLIDQYGPIFPKAAQRALDVAKCAAKGEEGTKEVKIYHYQAFVREYLRYETPYRGLLVYHGLGSGKTCSAIAAAEALFGTRGLKIIVMTPFSLRDNFIGEISFCGFKHFRLQNHWTSLSLVPGATPEPGMVKLFAQNVYGIPETYFAKRARGRAQLNKIWIPDFEKKPNFDSLSPEDRDEIQTQLKATIENRIKFINYNGITAAELKRMVCATPDIFDNSIIVVDEIHNLTRLIQGSLELYLGPRTVRGTTLVKEALTPERKPLAQCATDTRYMRGYLFYRLFMDAKNAKVIGLSGTPLINFPEELGILMNILHGPIHTMEFTVTAEGYRDINEIIKKAVRLNENLDTVFIKATEQSTSVTVTRLPEQFTKILDEDSQVLGIKRRDPLKPLPTLEQVWMQLQATLKADGIRIIGVGSRSAKELLPSWDTPFRGAFLQEDGITLKNVKVLQKRIRGLVSYYRGIQGDVMPKIIKDIVVGVPLTGYSLKIYNKLRNQEIQVEMSKPKAQGTGGEAVWAEITEIASMKTPSNYRMSSRQACNFVFPEGISRPRPRNLEEQDAETGKDRDKIIDADVEERAPGREEGEGESISDSEDAVVKAEGTGATGAAVVLGTKEQTAAYRAAIKSSKDKLRSIGKTHLRLDGPPEHNLARYSPKFAAMLGKINSIRGSSLVYSQFLEMEGVGIFGICMEANDYVPIEIIDGGDGKLKFSDRTTASLLKGPKVPENRYIEFTGTGSKEQRRTAVNVFNARLDKVPPAIQKVLQDGGWTNNLDGGMCRVICITSAGAEGLSLKTVRGVHIMEPYWNTARTQQVKGRAVRICSHMELPPLEQNVEIYTYCTIIPEEAILAQAVDKTLERSDTYNAKAAQDLGVPVPAPSAAGLEIPKDMFFKVDEPEKMNAAPTGAQGMLEGPVKFYSKLDNEYRGFSNFAPSPVTIDGKRYATVEHYFQSMKFPSDIGWQEAIRVSATPAKAKLLGSQTDHMIRPDWDSVKEGIMLNALRAKFQQNRGLLDQLKGTGTRPLVEASVDQFWGEGRTGKGKNRLGKLLEQVREELREYVVPAGIAVAVPQEDFFNSTEDEVESHTPEGAPPEDTEGHTPEGPPPETEFVDELMPGPMAMPAPVAAPGPAPGPGPLQQGGAPGDDRIIILTSDQKVLLISLRKERVIGSLQTLMKTVAVDCQLNFPDNNDGTFRCLSLGDSVGDFAYHPDLQEDISETEAKYRTEAPVAAPLQEPSAPMAALVQEPSVPMAAPMAAPLQEPSAPVPTKRRRMALNDKIYYYIPKLNAENQPLGYILYNTTDPKLTNPIGFIVADPITKLPIGKILPVPV